MPEPDTTEPDRPEPSRGAPWRPWAKRAVGVLVAVLLTELGAALVYAVSTGAWFSVDRMHARRLALTSAEEAPSTPRSDAERRVANFHRETRLELSEQVVHPYVGFVHDPSDDRHGARPPFVHAAALFDDESEAVRVLVVGGSVAGQVCEEGRESLLAALGAGPLQDREVQVVSLTEGGYKQPQQLSLVAYLLSVGARFDVLLNLDGFNEAVLPWAENASAGVYPLYPRWWDLRLIGVDESGVVADVGAVRFYRDLRRDAAQRLEESFLRHTVFANVVWDAADRWAEGHVYEHSRALEAHRGGGSYQSAGPSAELSREETLALSADNWVRSSILLDRLSRQSEFVYVHVLQPNQYLDGRKPLSDEEQRLYYRPDGPYGRVAADGYAALFAEAPRLGEAGVRYHDLTRIFEDDGRTLYMDDCCHLNRVGVDLLASRVGELVVSEMPSDE